MEPLVIVQICFNGECIDAKHEALRQCTQYHRLNFEAISSEGTNFVNHFCLLRCMIEGKVMSETPQHDALPCPHDLNGVSSGSSGLEIPRVKGLFPLDLSKWHLCHRD